MRRREAGNRERAAFFAHKKRFQGRSGGLLRGNWRGTEPVIRMLRLPSLRLLITADPEHSLLKSSY